MIMKNINIFVIRLLIIKKKKETYQRAGTS